MVLILDVILVGFVTLLAFLSGYWANKHKTMIHTLNSHPFLPIVLKKIMVLLAWVLAFVTLLILISAWRLMQVIIDLGGYGVSAWTLVILYFLFCIWFIYIAIGYRLLHAAKMRFYP
ncbi:hypothetical protein SAMN05421731_102393 [Acinetobacter puyangensis]|uniref:Uncharacterized protein n=1 Tax=Acinetobacter puyangensis TaxID=1096779 RepID=A0A240E6K1_9GAMM|nr:hypothetical protein SAMN05421731_102393 [Acinetobacter puyangensis]